MRTHVAVPQVAARNALRLGHEVSEADTWGMDCHTRKNVVDAILDAGAFAHLRDVREQEQAEQQRQQQQQQQQSGAASTSGAPAAMDGAGDAEPMSIDGGAAGGTGRGRRQHRQVKRFDHVDAAEEARRKRKVATETAVPYSKAEMDAAYE